MKQVFVTGGSGFLGRHLIANLRAREIEVRALARSSSAAEQITNVGAQPVMGDLGNPASLQPAMNGCDVVFHAAAIVRDWGNKAEFEQVHVRGTQNVLSAAKAAQVPRFVHVSTEAVLAGHPKLHNVDERMPLPHSPLGPYSSTKGKAEKLVLAANEEGFATIVVRPRFVWGQNDTSLLPQILGAVRAGTFRWIDGGNYLTSTTHVENACEALLLAAEHGRGGEIYFVTDGPPVQFRQFLTELLKTQGVAPPKASVPRFVARVSAVVVESVWPLLGKKSAPPATRMAVKMLGEEVTINDAKARAELGYKTRVTHEQGLAEMSGHAQQLKVASS
jgi:nucleoside-diphosphate-sugar epimerase